MTGIAIEEIGHVQFEIQPAFGSRHQLLFFSSGDHPLAVQAVPCQIHLDGLGIVILAVLFEDTARLIQILQIVHPVAYARTGGVDPRPDDLSGLYHISIG